MSIEAISPDAIAGVLSELIGQAKHTCWIGALSFEDRCVASVQWLQSKSVHIESAVALNYSTQVRPALEDKRRREANRKAFKVVGQDVFTTPWQELTTEPYAFQAIQSLVGEIVTKRNIDFAIFDLTCLTKIHALGLAATLATTLKDLRWLIAYSSPENYGQLDSVSKTLGWKDIIVAPLAETAVLLYEAHSRGIIVTGHEAERLTVGLTEIEPSGGVIVVGDSAKRPDLGRLTQRVNRRVVSHLMKLRSSKWTTVVVDIGDTSPLDALISGEIAEARQNNAPVILFPNGPKSLVFSAALKLCQEYSDASWFVYPVPAAYDVNYSEGIAGTYWFKQRQF